jgi:23S rRNA pseudouridine1911/1915/1917 synthase
VPNPLLQVLSEDESLLAVNKPAGLVCHPTKGDEYSSLISRARIYLGAGSHPQLVNRLDRETSGVTLLAKDANTARSLRAIFERREVRKEYLAIVHGRIEPEHGMIDAPLGKDEQSHVAIKDCVRPDGAPAHTEFWVERRLERPFTFLRIVPETGRKHQIRIHLAHIGHPIVGDKLYGGDEDLYLALVEDRLTDEQRARLMLPFHALHARALEFSWNGKSLAIEAQPEPWFTSFLG